MVVLTVFLYFQAFFFTISLPQFSLCYPLRSYLRSRNFGLNSLEVNQQHDVTCSIHDLFAYGDGMCVCVFILFHLLVTSGCTTSVNIRDQRSFVLSISRGFCQVPSSLFLNLSYSTFKDENSSRPLTGEKTIYNVCTGKDDIYLYSML